MDRKYLAEYRRRVNRRVKYLSLAGPKLTGGIGGLGALHLTPEESEGILAIHFHNIVPAGLA